MINKKIKIKLSQEEITEHCRVLKTKSPEEIIKWAVENYSAGMMTALGYSGVALINMVKKYKINIYFIDTGCHFDETLYLVKQYKNVTVVKPDKIVDCWDCNPTLCCHHRKVEPLLRVLPLNTVWLSAIRKDQSPSRESIECIRYDERGTLLVHPFAYKTRDWIWNYIKEKKLLYNPLHDTGYPSIGCKYCTTPVQVGEDERAGRWRDLPKNECGINV